MSLFNMVSKIDPATFFLLPMIIPQHPEKWPRYLDCFTTARKMQKVRDIVISVPIDAKEKPRNIYVLLRVGGSNRATYEKEIGELRNHPNYLADEDDRFDPTYAHFVFSVPDNWKDDYLKVCKGDFRSTSHIYKSMILSIFPDLKDKLKLLFGNS